MSKKEPEQPGDDGPITAASLVDQAIAKHDLPKRGGAALDDWAENLAGEEAQRHGAALVAAARRADWPSVVHFAHQAETAHLRDSGRPKPPSRS